jgi:uncharacterized protein (DUF927 family)
MTASRIDFNHINAAALPNLDALLPRWLPGGRFNGPEYDCGNLDGEAGRSLRINMNSGVWKDFDTDEGGSDIVSLYAAIYRLEQGVAARRLANELGIDSGGNGAAYRPKAKAKPADDWRPILPVPDDAPAPVFLHNRYGQPVAHWTYRDGQGRVVGYACRFEPEQGRKEILPVTYCQGQGGLREWRFKSFPAPRPLYGLDRLAGAKSDVPVLLVEGEKTADAAARLLPGAVCMTWPSGSKAVKKANFKPLAGRRVAVWPDADKPGFEAALELAVRVKEAGAVEVSVIAPPDGLAEGWDLADGEAEGWTPEKAKTHIQVHKLDVAAFEVLARDRYSIKPKAAEKSGRRTKAAPSAGPSSFVVKPDGIYFRTDDDLERVCSPLAVLAMTRDGEGHEWGRLLEIVDSDGTAHRWPLPMSMLAGDGNDYRRELLSKGLRLASGMKAKNRLHDFLTISNPEARARCVSRVGWHNRRFVLPDAVYGSQDGEEVILQGGPVDHAFRVAGSLEDWQAAIGQYCPGNSRLVVGVSAALAAPLLSLAGAESGGLHFHGGSSLGKTTLLRVAGSVCGGGGIKGYHRQWRATSNGLESVAVAHTDSLLCLDEMGQADAKTTGETAYMLCNQGGKSRARRDGTARKPQEWRTLFLSTGEITLADKVREDVRGRVMAGQQVRVVDIPADAGAGLGLFENIHGFESANAFARHLGDASIWVYGAPLRAFLAKLTAQLDEAAQAAPALVKEFVAENCPADADGQVARVASRFGLVAAAGEFGIALEVLPWAQGEARQAAVRCFQDWLEARGGTGAAEVTAGLAQVRQFFQAHGASRFETWGETADAAKIINRAGFKKKNAADEWEYFVPPSTFRSEVARGHDEKRLVKELVARGLILVGKDRPATQHRVPGQPKNARYYHFPAAVVAGEE